MSIDTTASGPVVLASSTRLTASGQRTLAPLLIVLAAVLFNPVLAIVNGNVRPLTSAMVIIAEISIVAAAFGCALGNFDRRMTIWLAFVGFFTAFALLRTLAVGAFEVRYIRDLLMIPTFVTLGMVATERRVIQSMLILEIAVVLGILLEAVSLDGYSSLFQVKDYYINTRGMVSDEFTNESSRLFVSATRPDARFFPFFDLHRLSSIFLEPVSLGNFAVISVAFTLAFWPRLSASQRLFFVAAIVLTLFACDGRLSSMASLAILVVAMMARALPRNVALLILPLVTAATVAVSVLGDFKIGTDDLPGRLAHTQHWLSEMWLTDILGASTRLLPEAEDSGIVYLVITQSLLGVVVLWCLVVLGLPERTPAHQHYKNSICIYLALTMMVSFSTVTIKTAAPLWFVYGFLVVAGAPRASPRRAEDPAAINRD